MNKKQAIINDAVTNVVVGLPAAQTARLHGCSKSYVSKLCKQAGITVDRRSHMVVAPAAILKSLLFDEVQ